MSGKTDLALDSFSVVFEPSLKMIDIAPLMACIETTVMRGNAVMLEARSSTGKA